MNEEKTARRYELGEPGHRSRILAKLGAELTHAGELQNFIVQEGETRILSYRIEELQAFYKEIRPKSVDDIKDMLGVPNVIGLCGGADSDQKENIRKTALERNFSFQVSMPPRVDISRLRSRIIPPRLLSSSDVGEEDRAHMMDMARMATEAYIYGDSSQVSQWVATINEYLRLKNAVIFVPYFSDIIVHRNATLRIAADTHAVYARRIKLYGNGRVLCEGPTTFDCDSFEGFL